MQSSNFKDFRNVFLARLEKLFLTPANTFDNVKGSFPIGFFIWDCGKKEIFNLINADIYDKNSCFIGTKNIYSYDDIKNGKINDWLKKYYDKKNEIIGIMHNNKTDFQHSSQVVITTFDNKDHTTQITFKNLISMSIYLTIRHVFPATWLNDRDQFLFPNDGWKNDLEFQNDCLAFTLFHGQNRITSSEGTNHWIPFTEYEVNAQAKFESNFMTNFIKGKIKHEVTTTDLFSTSCQPELVSGSNEMLKQVQHDTNIGVRNDKTLEFSEEATAVFDAGRELWKYYHAQNGVNVNASLYDIREYFQGRNDKGRMNSKSDDATYTKLIAELRSKLAILADKIKPKVYEYGFLKE